MLLRAVPERALGALLSSELVASTLSKFLGEAAGSPTGIATRSEWDQWREVLRQAVQTDVDARTARRHRLNEIASAVRQLFNGLLADRNFPALTAVFDQLFQQDHERIHFRYEQVQGYAELLSELDPTLLVAWRLASGAPMPTFRSNSAAAMRQMVQGLSTLFVGPAYLNRAFAENHSHLNGIAGDEFVLAELVLFFKSAAVMPDGDDLAKPRRPVDESPGLLRQNRIHRLLDVFVNIWQHAGNATRADLDNHDKRLARACRPNVMMAPRQSGVDWKTLDDGIVVGPADDTVNNRWMLKQLANAASSRKLQQAWTWLFTLLWRTYREGNRSVQTRAAVLLLIVDIMVLRREMIMDGNGLRRFTTQHMFSRPRTMAKMQNGAWDNVSQQEAIRRTYERPDDRAEIKISASAFDSQTSLTLAQHIAERLGALYTTQQGEQQETSALHGLDRWHFCLHFNRSGSEPRHKRRAGLWKEAANLQKTLRAPDRWEFTPLMTTQPAPGALAMPLATQLGRGLDVAGDETGWPIEIFAPMLRWLRQREPGGDLFDPPNLPVFLLPQLPPFHLSVHAGEDYAHPLSGLRHVDETVVFCGMCTGDRIGHALALGIPPDAWLRRHGEVTLPVDDHLDNLVWAWHEASCLAQDAAFLKIMPQTPQVLQRLATRIARFFPHVSWRPSAPVPLPALQELYQAWRLRRNCTHLTVGNRKADIIVDSMVEVGAPDLAYLPTEGQPIDLNTAAGLYVQRANVERDISSAAAAAGKAAAVPVMVRLSHPRHGYAPRAQTLRETAVPDALSLMYDHDDIDDVRLMLALQDVCIERYAQAGIAIETNPTSNVYIGQLDTHSDHPIYRWHPPDNDDLRHGGRFNEFGLRTMPMPVTINTDDQGIVPTTLRMEYHLMHEAALERGHSETVADSWIEDLRQLGLAQFDYAHERSA